MSTSKTKLFEEIKKTRGELGWLSGFAVFGSLFVLPGILSITQNLDLDGDPRQAGWRFFAFNIGFLIASALSEPLLKRVGIRPLAAAGLGLGIISLFVLTVQSPPGSFWWELMPVGGAGIAASSIAIASVSALTPPSSRLRTLAVPSLAGFSCMGCVFSAIVASAAYALGWGRFAPLPIALGAMLCLLFCLTGRQPLGVVNKLSKPANAKTRQLRAIASFLLMALVFVQLGSEWSVAAWLPLFVIHRQGSGPAAALLLLGFYFVGLLVGRIFARQLASRMRPQILAISGAVLVVAGSALLSSSTSQTGLWAALLLLAAGFSPPYPIVSNILEGRIHFTPAFYRALLSLAVTGAMCAAWLLGYVHRFLGMQAMALFPAIGAVTVVFLELLLMFESHLMGERIAERQGARSAVDRRMS